MTSEPHSRGPATCVVCRKPQSPELRPFCSKRCADIDLGRWLKGGYVIPGTEPAPGKPIQSETPEDDESH
ncbi:MAG: DNA gyrase inhibitor YacG [Rhizomicrobium sp.]